MKINSRKNPCPICKVKSGSRHNKACRYAYILPKDSKRIKQKISLYKKLLLLLLKNTA